MLMFDLQAVCEDARAYAVAYFAERSILSWGEPDEWLRVAIMGEEF
jgi:hypothetical protein